MPDGSVQLTDTELPGSWAMMALRSALLLLIAVPLRAVMTDPTLMPAPAAGLPPWTVTTCTALFVSWVSTPSRARVLPMWTVLVPCPDWICLTTEMALLIGMA